MDVYNDSTKFDGSVHHGVLFHTHTDLHAVDLRMTDSLSGIPRHADHKALQAFCWDLSPFM